MKIAIQAADLDAERIDGTRVYILNLLKHFGELDSSSEFLIYHKKKFNPELTPPYFSNYRVIKKPFPFFWTQSRFAWEIWKDKPDVLWMPMQALPFWRRKELKTVVTIHDLAFKYFLDHFPRKDLRRLNWFSDYAIKKADKIIAVSQSTKKDILKFYPRVKEEKIKVIYHGFDQEVFQKSVPEKDLEIFLRDYGLKPKKYILYAGAIQPRKNLETLISAFEIFKTQNASDVKLVLAGEKAWLWEETVKKALRSPFKEDIIMPGKLKFRDLGRLMRGAAIFVLPSLYEGFGIPVLEALAAGVPVICSRNSSLPEVGGEAAVYFDAGSAEELAEKIGKVLADENLRNEMAKKGEEQLKKFSWEKCARETLEYLKY